MLSGGTKIVALIGDPVNHSISPTMHNAAFEKLGLDYAYVAFKVTRDSLPTAISGIRSLRMEGANVTIPHKAGVLEHMDEINESARAIGAVNTIKRVDGRLRGFNTDGVGALRALKDEIGRIEGKKVLLLGAGGAARAIAYTLVERGVHLTISNRTASKAEDLVSSIDEKVGVKVELTEQKEENLTKVVENSDILINCTSVGMHPNEDESLLKAESMHSELAVMDIVYSPIKTRLLRESEKAGAKTISGLGMLVHQGATSFKIWTDKDAPVKTMKEAARKAIIEG